MVSALHRPMTPLLGVLLVVASVAPADAQRFEGKVTITQFTFDDSFLYDHAGPNGDDIRGVMAVSMDDIMAAAERYDADRDVTVMHVKGSRLRADIQPGLYMIMDAGSGRTTMARQGQFYTSFTAEEFEQEIGAMMGGMGGQRGGQPSGAPSPSSIRSMMAQAMGGSGEPPEVTEPRSLGERGQSGSASCEWYEANAGDVTAMEGAQIMAEAVLVHACVTRDHPDAYETYKYLQEQIATMPMAQDEEGLNDQIEQRLLEHGLPVLTKTVSKGGGVTPSFAFEASAVVLEPGAVADNLFSEHESTEELPLRQFFMRMMGGMR